MVGIIGEGKCRCWTPQEFKYRSLIQPKSSPLPLKLVLNQQKILKNQSRPSKKDENIDEAELDVSNNAENPIDLSPTQKTSLGNAESSTKHYSTSQKPSNNEHLKNWAIKALNIDNLFWDLHQLSGNDIKIACLGSNTDWNVKDLAGRITLSPDFYSHKVPSSGIVDSSWLGIIAGNGREKWLGVAPKAEIYLAKVIDHGFFEINVQSIIDGIHWAISQNVSLLFFGFDLRPTALKKEERTALKTAIVSAYQKNIICVSPVGEGNSQRPLDRWPSSLPQCLSVGAHDKSFDRINSSLRSYTLDVMAPGVDLTPINSTPHLSYNSTLMAAAFTTAILALIIEYCQKNGQSFSAQEWMDMIKTTAIPKYSITKCKDIEYGCGKINPEGILEAIIESKMNL